MKPEALSSYPAADRRSSANLSFNALLFVIVGWAALERWSFLAGAGTGLHLIIAAACAPVLACSLRRFRAACPRHMCAAVRPRATLAAAGQALAVLFAVGALFGYLAARGSVTMVVLAAVLCCFAPWTRLRVHQQHLFLSFLALTGGSFLAPALAGQTPSLMAALPAAWCLWATAAALCVALCGDALLQARRRR